MKRCSILIFFLLVSTFYSCANYFTVKQNTLFEMKKPNDETARIVFIRPASGHFGQGYMSLYDEYKLIGILPGLTYFTYNAKPGEHIFGGLHGGIFDFLHAELESGKTYYVFCARFEAGFAVRSKILAIKKGSDMMLKVPEWLPKLKQAELTDEGIEILKVRNDKKGKFVELRAFGTGFRMEIEASRKQWLEKVKTTGKPSLSIEDGV